MYIFDENKHVFYFHPNDERKITFNLPPGKYYTDNTITKLPKFEPYEPRTYPDLKLDLNDIVLIKKENPNKASISLQKYKGKIPIIVDPQFFDNEYKPLKTATLLHEIFHSCFNSNHLDESQRQNYFIRQHIEKQCDDAARNFMLVNGWNPSQISLAFKLLLKGKDRRNCIAQNTTGKHSRR